MPPHDPLIDTTNVASTCKRRWYQFSIWHLLVAMTVLAVAASILAHMLKPEPPVPVEVQGSVRFDGKPLSTGVITFVSADGKTKRRLSQQVRNGIYASFDAVERGVYLVEISSPQTTDDGTVETIPSHYNTRTTLTMQLLQGSNTIDFDLSSQ